MKIKTIKIFFLFVCSFALLSLQAQEANTATGGEAIGSGGSISYSVGQIFYTSNTGTNGNSISQGVQQAYEISEVIGIEKQNNIDYSVSIFPNPTTDYITLEIKELEVSTLQYQLYDMQGKLLQSNRIKDNQTQIDMSDFVSATYFVKLTNQNQLIKNFKIIKN